MIDRIDHLVLTLRSGAMTSVYFRDPDGNLIEVSAYDRASQSAVQSGPE